MSRSPGRQAQRRVVKADASDSERERSPLRAATAADEKTNSSDVTASEADAVAGTGSFKRRRRKKDVPSDLPQSPPSDGGGVRMKGRSRRSSVMAPTTSADSAAASAAAAAASLAAAAAATAQAATPPVVVRSFFTPGLLQRPMLGSPDAVSTNPTKWIYLDTPPAPLIFDPAQPHTILTLVTVPRRRHEFKCNLDVTVRQLYAHVKHLSGVTEAFHLLYSYPHRVLLTPDATLVDLQFENMSVMQRLYSELPPPSTIGVLDRSGATQQRSLPGPSAARADRVSEALAAGESVTPDQ